MAISIMGNYRRTIATDRLQSGILVDENWLSFSEIIGKGSVSSLYASWIHPSYPYLLLSYDPNGDERWRNVVYDVELGNTLVEFPAGLVGHAVNQNGCPIVGIMKEGYICFFKLVISNDLVEAVFLDKFKRCNPDWTYENYQQYYPSLLASCGYSTNSVPLTIPTSMNSKNNSSSYGNDDIEISIDAGDMGKCEPMTSLRLNSATVSTWLANNKYSVLADSRFFPFYYTDRWHSIAVDAAQLKRSFGSANVDDSLMVPSDAAKTGIGSEWARFRSLVQKKLGPKDKLHTASGSFSSGVILSREIAVDHDLIIHKGDISSVRDLALESQDRIKRKGALVIFQASNDTRVEPTSFDDLALLSSHLGMTWCSVTYNPGGHASCPPLISDFIRQFQLQPSDYFLPSSIRKSFP
ncbi:hypothetical protein QP952_05850 [Corynebacterium pseudodiphtheriticum]|uniref:hypothetical protein n=1 Tax=Corynebacterium pseudodiphtheriticum TaxID=37637 RepID=UPI00254C807F|nr:hypothetical protein [Corynebacterium pseudodiphtheriticum]MDK8709195.1 hypothetical protein [Corynebacterium pseudodiphtheriticum]